ncbi:MAG: RagB/SusD family nutrient uptake outer membrane protein [Bacteroidales bacterium]|nr:RagB/SusD family nutrient uptake outer membrane protein [Bacteroidales bacterium]
MKKILLTISIIGAFAVSACTDLTENVYSSLTQSSYQYSPKDLRPVVGACYTPMRSYMSHTGLWAMDNTTTDMLVMPPNSTGWDDGGRYRRMHYHSWNSEQGEIQSAWNATWKGIGLCNNALSQMEINQLGLDDATLKAAIAELRALRAYYYWVVLDNWGDAPLVTAPTQELPVKVSRKEIYDFVVKETTEAIPDLSDVQGGVQYGLMNKWAAYALLARTYVNAEVYTGTAQWQAAIDACDAIINSGKFQLSPNFRDNFLADQGKMAANKEVIFTIPFDQSLATGFCLHLFSWGAPVKAAFNIASTPWGSGCAMAVPEFAATYDEDDSRLEDSFLIGTQYKYGTDEPIKCIYDAVDGVFNDLAYTKEIQSGNFTMEWEGYRMNKFEVLPDTPGNLDNDQPIFRYAEILLTKAECLLRLGKSGAGDLVSQVRARAFKDNPAKAAVTDAQLKENTAQQYGYYTSDYGATLDKGDTSPVVLGRMYDEYKWEFAWEFGNRSRCIRFGVFTKKNWVSHKSLGDYTALYPIPESARTPNPGLEQNPNYK